MLKRILLKINFCEYLEIASNTLSKKNNFISEFQNQNII